LSPPNPKTKVLGFPFSSVFLFGEPPPPTGQVTDSSSVVSTKKALKTIVFGAFSVFCNFFDLFILALSSTKKVSTKVSTEWATRAFSLY